MNAATLTPTRLPFLDRDDAARRLALALARFRGSNPLVLAIPRGAVPMGRVIANALGGELDVVLVRKLGAPGNPELAIGAVDERGELMFNPEHMAWTGADEDYVHAEARRQLALIRERRAHYRPGQPAANAAGRTVIVVDDGLATGATMMAALKAVRRQNPSRLVCAVPVAAAESLGQVRPLADEVVCLATPRPFHAVGLYYQDFAGVDDAQVIRMLADAPHVQAGQASPISRRVRIPAGGLELDGDLVIPVGAQGLVVFVHGSGSSRHSPRNQYVARELNRRGFATLLFDLLTAGEDRDPAMRFDIGMLARRLDAALDWSRDDAELRGLPLGLFGASTGAAVALVVAAARPREVRAVTSRGGRPDLAGARSLALVRAPSLLIVGSADTQVLELNRAARAAIGANAELAIVPGATHLFEEPGTLERAAALASDWFQTHLP